MNNNQITKNQLLSRIKKTKKAKMKFLRKLTDKLRGTASLNQSADNSYKDPKIIYVSMPTPLLRAGEELMKKVYEDNQ